MKFEKLGCGKIFSRPSQEGYASYILWEKRTETQALFRGYIGGISPGESKACMSHQGQMIVVPPSEEIKFEAH
jgi:hypothetical protein